MSHQTKTHGGSMDSFKWAVVVALIASGVIGNHHFSDQSVLIRLLVLLVLIAATCFVALRTSKGQKFWQFALEARAELRKVVWPNRQETIQTTLMVLAIVSIVGFLLWGIDALLLKFIALLTGYGAH